MSNLQCKYVFRKTLEWENLGRTDISALLDKDLERLTAKASSSRKPKNQNGNFYITFYMKPIPIIYVQIF